MTCVCGIRTENGVWIGADSIVTYPWYGHRRMRGVKVFRRIMSNEEQFVIGSCGSPRMLQLLQYQLNLTETATQSGIAYMVTEFVEVVRELFKNAGVAKVENNEESGGLFLAAYDGALYRIDSDYQVMEMEDGMMAIGSGDDWALGAMKAREDLEPEARIRCGLETASYFTGTVGPPFVIEKL